MSNDRELNEEELKALELNSKAGISRSALENGEMHSETMEGKLENDWHDIGMKAMQEKGIKITKNTLAALDAWVKDQVANVTARRNAVRERNMKLIKEFGPGGRFAGRTLDKRALFKGDEMEDIAMKPGGISDAMSMKSSLPTAIAYLNFLKKEGYETYADVPYDKVIY